MLHRILAALQKQFVPVVGSELRLYAATGLSFAGTVQPAGPSQLWLVAQQATRIDWKPWSLCAMIGALEPSYSETGVLASLRPGLGWTPAVGATLLKTVSDPVDKIPVTAALVPGVDNPGNSWSGKLGGVDLASLERRIAFDSYYSNALIKRIARITAIRMGGANGGQIPRVFDRTKPVEEDQIPWTKYAEELITKIANHDNDITQEHFYSELQRRRREDPNTSMVADYNPNGSGTIYQDMLDRGIDPHSAAPKWD